MKASEYLKKLINENRDDLLYILLVGVPTLILMILLRTCIDYSHLY